MTTTTQKSPIEYIIKGLQTAASELEELQVQIALGKAEASDVFENIKKSLHKRIQQLKSKIVLTKTNVDLLPVVNALEHLQVQLALGIAETKEVFEEQRKKIEHSLSELESKLKSGAPGKQVAKMQLEIEKFKAKLLLLSLSYKLKKIYFEYDMKQKKQDFEQKLKVLKTKLEFREEKAKNKWQHFKDEITEAFDDMKSTFLPID
ncbi:hypothetical protein [Aurantibacillus circumpalustris]|uniref:hypothetical protein n=1 Tax=Aurantibacillus circumpalustris TaxID=3036359 RepID=UPI00295BA6E3|nr:hypothetical protein [Aurantibacillus circumpalustris]